MSETVITENLVSRSRNLGEELRIELLRKSIHLSIAIVPTLAGLAFWATVGLLAAGTLAYACFESLRRAGVTVPLVSRLTALAARRRDAGHFVLGPVTLGLGALLALLLYPAPAASLAIYALAFGDGLSSLVGKLWGTVRLPLTGGKSLEGSLTCFTAVYASGLAVGAAPRSAALIALVTTLVEAAPLKDLDNIFLPMVAGAMASILLV
jgi:dolichol kinase